MPSHEEVMDSAARVMTEFRAKRVGAERARLADILDLRRNHEPLSDHEWAWLVAMAERGIEGPLTCRSCGAELAEWTVERLCPPCEAEHRVEHAEYLKDTDPDVFDWLDDAYDRWKDSQLENRAE